MTLIHKVLDATFTKSAPGTYDATMSEGTADRTGEKIRQAGWVVPARGVPFLWAHQPSELPIGRVREIRTVGDTLRGVVEFPPRGVYAFADQVVDLIEAGFLHAVSVGFRVIEGPRDGWTYFKQELLELSLVNVPALPAAGIDGRADDSAMRKWLGPGADDLAVLILDDEPDDDPVFHVRSSELSVMVRDAVADAVIPLRQQIHRLSARAPERELLATEPVAFDVDETWLAQTVRDALRELVGRETNAALNALRGRID